MLSIKFKPLLVLALMASNLLPSLAAPHYQGTNSSPNVSPSRSKDRKCGQKDSAWYPSPENWKSAEVDKNLQTFIKGGKDTEGLIWDGLQGRSFAQALGADIINKPNWPCTIADPCPPTAVDCELAQSRWGYLALNAMSNLNQQLYDVFHASTAAAGSLDLRASEIATAFHPFSDVRDFSGLMKGLGILSFAASTLSTIFGLAGPEFKVQGAVAGITSSAASYAKSGLAQHVADRPEDQSLEQFRVFVGRSMGDFYHSVESLTNQLANGQMNLSNTNITIYDILANGRMTQSPSVNQTDLIQAIEADFTSRAVNSLWRNAPTTDTKIWVSFANLPSNDSNACTNDMSGPQMTKHCADGGVYYLYHFNETHSHSGYLDRPFGLDKMKDYGIDPSSITASSARSYRATPNGYDYESVYSNTSSGRPDSLAAISKDGGLGDFLRQPAALEGVWTLPVCDMGDHRSWNQDYVSHPAKDGKYTGPLPCMCGPGGSKTADFVKAAKMSRFDTLLDWCGRQLKNKSEWPQGVEQVNYGYGSPIHKPR